MKIKKLMHINELAQDFLKSPRISRNGDRLYITYDYEMDSGKYSEKSICFENVKNYRHVSEQNTTADMIEAYNSIGEVVDSDWIGHELLSQGFKHYIIYFDDYGTQEIIADNFRLVE